MPRETHGVVEAFFEMGGVQAMTAASEEFGRLVRQARTKLGLSQRELAEILGVNRNETISLWERGRSIPHKTTLLRCIDQLGLDKEVVLELKDVHYDELITLKDEKRAASAATDTAHKARTLSSSRL